MTDGQRLLQLTEHVALRHLVGMHLQTEGVEAYVGQTALHHTQGSHLLSHEEHPLSLEERVGNEVGNGLRLTRSWRTVENERMPFTGFQHGSHLRRVGSHRQRQHLRSQRLVLFAEGSVQRSSLPGEPPFHQTLHYGAFLQFLAMVVHIVPHQIFAEREDAEDALFLHVPPLLLLQGLTDDGEDESHVHTMVIGRQLSEFGDIDLIVLPEEFHQRHVEHNLLVAGADVVAAFLIHHLHGQHQHRRIVGLLALFRLIPAQRSDGHEKRVGTRLLNRVAGRAVDILEHTFRLRFREIGVQLMMTDVGAHQFADGFGKSRADKPSPFVVGLEVHVGPFHDVVFLTVLQMVLYLVYVE